MSDLSKNICPGKDCGLELCNSDCKKILCKKAHKFEKNSDGIYSKINKLQLFPQHHCFCDKCFVRLEYAFLSKNGASCDNASLGLEFKEDAQGNTQVELFVSST